MDYMAISELKRTKQLWERLEKSKEVVLTRDGKPGALMLEVSPGSLETVVAAVRRALFSEAVSNARARAERTGGLSDKDIEREIAASRR